MASTHDIQELDVSSILATQILTWIDDDEVETKGYERVYARALSLVKVPTAQRLRLSFRRFSPPHALTAPVNGNLCVCLCSVSGDEFLVVHTRDDCAALHGTTPYTHSSLGTPINMPWLGGAQTGRGASVVSLTAEMFATFARF